MHTYRIEAYLTDEQGATTTKLDATQYADSHEQARLVFYNLYNQYKVDEETGEPTNVKKYKVRLHILCYHQHENPAEYFAQYQQ